MKSNYKLFWLTALVLVVSVSCSGSTESTTIPITMPPTMTVTMPSTATTTPLPIATETLTPIVTGTLVSTEWLFQVTVTIEQLGPVMGGTLGGRSGYNWGILETQTPIKEEINPIGVLYEGEGLPQMCARGVLVDGQPMVTSLTNGACPVETPIP